MVASVAIRLGTDGSAQVKADFAAIAESGDASAKRIVSAYDRASDDVAKAIERQSAAAARLQSASGSPVLASINRSVGTGYDASANANAAQYAALLAAEERQIEAVRTAIDPLYTAQKRYDDEVRIAGDLLKRGAIGEAEHAAAVRVSAGALAAAERNLEEHTGALSLNRMQFVTAQSAVLRFTDAILAGQNPIRAFALEAHKGAEVLALDDGGFAGGLAKVSAILNPVTLGVAAVTVALAIGTAAWVSYTDAVAKLETVADGAGAVIGVTGRQLEANAEATARGGVLTVSAARDIETGYVRMGGVGAGVLPRLTQLTADFAAATGTDMAAAQQALGKAFQDPVKGAEELAARYGLLSQAQVEQIRQLVEENDLYGAQARLLDDLGPAFDGAAKHAEGLRASFDEIKSAISGAWATLGGFLTGISAATPAAARLADLQAKRTQLGNTFAPGLRADLDKQIADVQAEITRQQAQAGAAGNKFAQDAVNAGSDFTGHATLEALKRKQAEIRRALSDPGSVATLQQSGMLDQTRQSLEAYTHAVDTFLAPAEKKRLLDEAEARLAQARTPAAKQAAGAAKEEIELRGQVVTRAEAEADALAKGDRARARLDNAAAKHAATLGREADAMDATTRGALASAAAYLDSASAGEEAEARAKATAASAKNGADAEAAIRRQLAQSVAEGALAGAKAVSALKMETAARSGVDVAVASGALKIADMSRALGDEQALRALTIKQSLAWRLGLTDDYAKITDTIAAYKQALSEAHDEEGSSKALQSLAAFGTRISDAELTRRHAGDTSGDAERARALAEANRQADAGHFDVSDRGSNNAAAILATNAELDARRAASAAAAIKQSRDGLAVTQLQLGMLGKSADAQQRATNELKLQQQLAAELGDQYATYAPAILAAANAAEVSDTQLQRAQATMAELREQGDRFVEDLFNPDGSGLKHLLKDVEQELIKLAAINPLKNMLDGGNAPTLSSAGGLLSKLFGGGVNLGSLENPGLNLPGVPDTLTANAFNFTPSVPAFASGTESTPGGLAWVGEQGPELVDMPAGARVSNAADTRRMMAANDDGGARVVHNHFSGNLLTPEFWAQIQAGDDHAAMRGSSGGAQLAMRDQTNARRRRLGSR